MRLYCGCGVIARCGVDGRENRYVHPKIGAQYVLVELQDGPRKDQ